MGVTIKDIARTAGVSYSTVSKALNNSPLVQESTKLKILKIAKELGYQPNIVAKSLVSKKSRTIGVVWPTIERIALSTILTKINQELEKEDYSMILSINAVNSAITMFQRLQVDGILIFDEQNHPSKKIDIRPDVPILYYGDSDNPSYPTIDLSRREAIYKAVEYLYELGHSRIAYVGDLSHQDSRQIEKYIGFTEAIIEFSLSSNPKMLVNTNGLGWYDGYLATKSLLQSPFKPTALIGGSYDINVGIVRAIKEKQLLIPTDISIIGYDNVPQMAAFEVPLTAVGAPSIEIAKTVVKSLIGHINEPKSTPFIHKVNAEIVRRESSAPPNVK